MKKYLILILISLIFNIASNCFAATTNAPVKLKPVSAAPNAPITAQQQIKPQIVDFAHCNKYFKIDAKKLFYLTLASINANRFQINEIQSKSGYILFTAAKKQFLASVIMISSQSSMLKITPCDNVYIFPIGIVQNMFKYIELNSAITIDKLN